jgi:hypothetical protein
MSRVSLSDLSLIAPRNIASPMLALLLGEFSSATGDQYGDYRIDDMQSRRRSSREKES